MSGFVPSLTARRMASGFGAVSSHGPAGFHTLPVEVVVRSGVTLTPAVGTSSSTPANSTRTSCSGAVMISFRLKQSSWSSMYGSSGEGGSFGPSEP